jgi:hypothetical protein
VGVPTSRVFKFRFLKKNDIKRYSSEVKWG